MQVQVLKQFVAFGRELNPPDIFDASNVNIGRLNKLIAQRFVIPIKIQEGEIKSVPVPTRIEATVLNEDEPVEERKGFERSETAKKKWANPQFREERSSAAQIAAKKIWADPEYRAKRAAQQAAKKAAKKAAKNVI